MDGKSDWEREQEEDALFEESDKKKLAAKRAQEKADAPMKVGKGWAKLKQMTTVDKEYDDYRHEKDKDGKIKVVKHHHWDRQFKLDAILAMKKVAFVDRRYYIHAQWLKMKDELQLAVYFVIGLSEAKMYADINFGTAPYAVPMLA